MTIVLTCGSTKQNIIVAEINGEGVIFWGEYILTPSLARLFLRACAQIISESDGDDEYKILMEIKADDRTHSMLIAKGIYNRPSVYITGVEGAGWVSCPQMCGLLAAICACYDPD